MNAGLDPVSKRAIWQIIDNARREAATSAATRPGTPGRVIMLVSHDMAEVEALCGSYVGIMSHARLRAVGSVQHLKKRYCSGYMLKLHFRGERLLPAAVAANMTVGAIMEETGSAPTDAWMRARRLIEDTLFPPGRGDAIVDSVYQSRVVGPAPTRDDVGTVQVASLAGPSATSAAGFADNKSLTATTTAAVVDSSSASSVVETGSASFILTLGRQQGQVPIATAFRLLRDAATSAGIVEWSLQQQSLEAVFSKVVKHFGK